MDIYMGCSLKAKIVGKGKVFGAHIERGLDLDEGASRPLLQNGSYLRLYA